MKTIFFDTETTALIPGKICQLSYIIESENSICGKNYFFKVDEVSSEAVRIHGLRKDMLKKLSGGNDFKYHSENIFSDFKSADLLVAHNIRFDLKFLKKEFKLCDKSLPPINNFCTMKSYAGRLKLKSGRRHYKYPSLSELTRFFQITSKEINNLCMKLFKTNDIKFHNSCFDVAAVYLCYNKDANNGSLY